ncbi:hypothetical protein ACFLV2_00765 [Chloroflexota bacterium]
MLKTLLKWGWYPAVITALAVVALIYGWRIEYVVPALVVILAIGSVVVAIGARDKQMGIAAARLQQLADYFSRRFMGTSSLSIFAIINTLFNTETPKLWEWARSCDMARRIFNTWCNSFVARMQNDIRAKKLAVFLSTYLNELWAITDLYYEYAQQFYEIAENSEIPPETLDQYNKFVMEYNAFVQDFRDTIADLRKVAKTSIDPPSVKFAKELTRLK